MKTKVFFFLVVCFLSNEVFAQKDSLRIKIDKIANTAKGTVGVAMIHLESRDTFTLNGNLHYPMQSVYKMPLAMAVLHEVDKGKLSLDQKIHIRKEELLPTWSPIKTKYPEGNVDLPLREILGYTVSQSDNNGCDILFRLLGGTANINKYVHRIGIDSIAIAATEEEMARAWGVQFTNWSTPGAILQLLDGIYKGKYLSKSSIAVLKKMMQETTTGPGRIRGLLSENTVVAHKTGTSGTNDKGVTSATNDAGVITLPNGKHFAIVVFVCNATADEKTRDAVIAQITKVFWDHFASLK
ncbi:beta-lactamase class A/beta-lactamase class A VEB [Chitinophaga sp. YR573]|uniref:class A beta-lactamase, subclass A2 n=1 Tax=Chitinophaga sp. YR573 TaxID=1881040 RepID=UPI0008D84DA2|nr:class A beta-lactamase, subclass A2 [Chitinophaga sp. YR573]SEW18123.1 beta-lactamase class A/beta-lactamase class A VEB [Chitinophaga sp. YR573]